MRNRTLGHARVLDSALADDPPAVQPGQWATDCSTLYAVDREPPFDPRAIDDAAAILRHAAEPGIELGRCSPRSRRETAGTRPYQPCDIAILVDRERGGHPFLDDVDWLIDRLRDSGLEIQRYDYAYQPYVLWPAVGGAAIDLAELARQSAGKPLLIVSRMLAGEDAYGSAAWPGQLGCWPARVHLDPDPRPLAERERFVTRMLEACAAAGLPRFALSADGIVLAAHRAIGMPVLAPPDDPPARRTGAELDDALASFASCAAFAPVRTWAELDASLRAIPGLAKALPHPGYRQRLIEWIWQRDPHRDPLGLAHLRAGGRLLVERRSWAVAAAAVLVLVAGLTLAARHDSDLAHAAPEGALSRASVPLPRLDETPERPHDQTLRRASLPDRPATNLRVVPYIPPLAPLGRTRDRATGTAVGVTHIALAKKAPMRFVGLTGGEFTMGSSRSEKGHDRDERPRRRVYLSPFEIAENEVTQAQWQLLMGQNPSACDIGCGGDLPVQNVAWTQAIGFANQLSLYEGFTPCYRNGKVLAECTGYRLPTEAEWEYAARAGSRRAYHFGDDRDDLDDYAWHSDYSVNARIRPVGQKKPNGFGLHDMHGNVWEWVGDWYGAYPDQPEVDPLGPKSGTERVIRGGSFVYTPRFLRAAKRKAGNRVFRPGLRLVRSRVLTVPAPPERVARVAPAP